MTYSWENECLQKYGEEITLQMINRQNKYIESKGNNNCKGCGTGNEGSIHEIKEIPTLIHFGLWTANKCCLCGKES